MMPHVLPIIACLGAISLASAASAQQVIAATGGHFQNATHGIAFTIGELVGATIGATDFVLTQGFHQPPADFSTAMAEVLEPNAEVTAFPNPSRDEVTVQVRGVEGTSALELFDATGRAVWARLAFNGSIVLDVSALASGTYHARITTDGAYLTTVQLSITR